MLFLNKTYHFVVLFGMLNCILFVVILLITAYLGPFIHPPYSENELSTL